MSFGRGLWLCWGALLALGLAAVGAAAEEASPPPTTEPLAVVGLARADHLYLSGPTYAPPGIYPYGKLDWDVVSALVEDSATAAGLPTPWTLFKPTDRVAVMIDTADPPVPLITVEAVLEQLVRAGVSTDRIFLFSSEEAALFAAGFSLRSEGNGVRCYGADAMGYRGGTSRLVLDMCDKIINLAVVHPHATVGMAGALFNYLNALDPTKRIALLQQPDTLGSLGLNRQIASRVVLNYLDCTHPAYEAGDAATMARTRWEYRGMICSRDAVAADTIGREILEAKRAQVKGEAWPLEPAPGYLEAAMTRYRVGISDRTKIRLVTVGASAEEPSAP
jgi:hypothetical protein